MHRKRQRLGVIALTAVVLVTLIISGCGTSAAPASTPAAPAAATTPSAEATSAPTAPPAAQTTPAATGEQPVAGGTATLAIIADPTFNPWHPNAYVESIFVNRVLFAGLTKPGKDLVPSPDLATKWESSADGLTWTFTLREGVKWSDGEPFTADDVAFTFNDIVLNKELGANGAGNYSAVKQVTVVDPQTIKFELSRPFSALPAYLAYNAGIVPKHVLQGQDPFQATAFNKERPVTTGPFKLESFTPGQSVVLARNEDYYGAKAHLDKLVFKILPDPNTQVAQVLSGELSVIGLDNKAAVDRVKGASHLKVEPRALVQYYWLCLNANDPLFQDVRVRQALLYAIDRKAIIKTVDKDFATIANSPISPALKAYYDPSLESKYPYDPEKAKQLLAEAGWKDDGTGKLVKDGQPFKVVMDYGQKGNLQPVNELVQQYWKQIGIQAELNAMEWNAMIKKVVVGRDYQVTINWWVYPSDPDVLPYFHSSAAGTGWNISGYKDPKLDQMLEKGQATSELEARKQIYKEIQNYMSEVLPYTFLWYPQEVNVVNTNLHWTPDLNLRDAMHYVNEWWVSE